VNVWVTLLCRRCGRPLGWTSARELVLPGGIVREAVTVVCMTCGKGRTWRPLGDGLNHGLGGTMDADEKQEVDYAGAEI
jgi:hypothetical protein